MNSKAAEDNLWTNRCRFVILTPFILAPERRAIVAEEKERLMLNGAARRGFDDDDDDDEDGQNYRRKLPANLPRLISV